MIWEIVRFYARKYRENEHLDDPPHDIRSGITDPRRKIRQARPIIFRDLWLSAFPRHSQKARAKRKHVYYILPNVLRLEAFSPGFMNLPFSIRPLVESLIAHGIIRPGDCNELMETVRKDRSLHLIR